jgi:hypothetical protein
MYAERLWCDRGRKLQCATRLEVMHDIDPQVTQAKRASIQAHAGSSTNTLMKSHDSQDRTVHQRYSCDISTSRHFNWSTISLSSAERRRIRRRITATLLQDMNERERFSIVWCLVANSKPDICGREYWLRPNDESFSVFKLPPFYSSAENTMVAHQLEGPSYSGLGS